MRTATKSLFLAGLFCIGLFHGATRAAPKVSVAIQPLGQVDGAILEEVQAGISSLYDVQVKLLSPKELPADAYYKPRQRYRAEKLLDFLLSLPQNGADKIIGVTEQDISTTKGGHEDWGIFGLGLVGGRVCVVSSFRLRKGPKGTEFFNARLVKVVNHELGHAFGLDHCSSANCLMEDAAGSIQTVDRETGDLCPACRAKLGGLVRPWKP